MMYVFTDTDVCLDLLTGRKPFIKTAQLFFSIADNGIIRICVSSLSFSNIDYILRSQYSTLHSRQLLAKFKTLVRVLSVDNKTIDLAIASELTDFEDAIQYACAIQHNIDTLVTRNIRDYKKATVRVLTPEQFLSGINP